MKKRTLSLALAILILVALGPAALAATPVTGITLNGADSITISSFSISRNITVLANGTDVHDNMNVLIHKWTGTELGEAIDAFGLINVNDTWQEPPLTPGTQTYIRTGLFSSNITNTGPISLKLAPDFPTGEYRVVFYKVGEQTDIMATLIVTHDLPPAAGIIQDPGFYISVLQIISKPDGYVITAADVAGIKTLNIGSRNIKSLSGVEYFTSLVQLWCGYNQLTSLDISKNTALEVLTCWYNQLTTLDTSKNTALKMIQFEGNYLTTIDVSKNLALEVIQFPKNPLTTLDVSKNTALRAIAGGNNRLTELDVSNNIALQELFINANQLTSLDVSKNTALRDLRIYNNQLTSLDVSKNTALERLWCQGNFMPSEDAIIGLANTKVDKNAKDNNGNFLYIFKSQYTPPPNIDTADDWARNEITIAVTKGFIPTDIQDEYTNVITRQEFCRMAIKFLEYKTRKKIDAILTEKGVNRDPSVFSDTSDPDILAAFALGITNGTSAGKFTPNGQFSREMAATMLMRLGKVIGMDTANPPASGFADIGTASDWAIDGINFCRAAGIMNGTSNTEFTPKGTFTRQESIVTFSRMG